MSTPARLLAVVGTVVVLVIAFVALSPGDDEPEQQPAVATQTATVPPPAAGTATTSTTAPSPAATPKPRYTAVVVRNGKPVGGVKRIEVGSGERARIEISSTDTADHVHIHGYDLMKNLEAGGRVRFAFKADADGIFEIELEDAGVQIAELVVSPG